MMNFVSGNLTWSKTALSHQILAKAFQAFHLHCSWSTEFKISDQADTDTGFVVRKFFHVTSIQLLFPSITDMNLSIIGFS